VGGPKEFHAQGWDRRSNATHQSTTDPDCRLFEKTRGTEAKLAYLGEVLMENRHGLVVDACVVPATGTGEPDAATSLIASLPPRQVTIGGDKAYDTRGFVHSARERQATPHVAQKRHSAIDARTTRHAGYALSQRARKRIEGVLGWMKTIGGMRKLRRRPNRLIDCVTGVWAGPAARQRVRTRSRQRGRCRPG